MTELQCDCCGALVPVDQIRTVVAYGIETSACARCRGDGDALVPDDSEPLPVPP